MLSKVLWYQGFPNGVGLWGNNLVKMAKNCMNITKSRFLGQNSGGTWWAQANFLGNSEIPPSLFSLGKTLGIKSTMSLRVLCHNAILLEVPVIKSAMLFFINGFATKPQPLGWL